MEANSNFFFNYMAIFEVFGSISGLRVNLWKSTILGINTEVDFIHNLANITGCEVGVWPISYLGLPLGGIPRNIAFWDLVVNKVAKRLHGWKKTFLSRGGRLTLIQSVLSSLPIYYLSLFKAPSSVIRSMEKLIYYLSLFKGPSSVISSLEKLMRDFFWEGGDLAGGDHVVGWEDVCKSKENRGLDIGNLEK